MFLSYFYQIKNILTLFIFRKMPIPNLIDIEDPNGGGGGGDRPNNNNKGGAALRRLLWKGEDFLIFLK